MYLKRTVDEHLTSWKVSKSRKPLLIRGARQVGKSSTIRQFGKSFRHFVEINFDENRDIHSLFESSKDIETICSELALITNTPVAEGKTLVFLDEIQACPAALGKLRYFYEQMPGLHVLAAGSLLEFVLAEIPSFGVGRIRSLFMYPLSFPEFLHAKREAQLELFLRKYDCSEPLSEIVHKKLISLYKEFLLIGGMPEIVSEYVQNKNLLSVQRLLDDLTISIQTDFAKYKSRFSTLELSEVWSAVAKQTGEKFSYSYPGATLNNKQVKAGLELLSMAGLVHQITHTSANGIPLGAESKHKFKKYLIYDTGIFHRLMNLDLGEILLNDDFQAVNKGGLAELFVGLELIKNSDCYHPSSLFYWHRESKNSQAEVDYVIQKGRRILPIEVKAGTKGSMQSLFLFLKEKNIPGGIRISLENFGKTNHIQIFPIYAAHIIPSLKNSTW